VSDASPDGARTGGDGTPVAVDVSRDRTARIIWVPFLGGPVIWISHFMLVYLVAETGCSGDGRGFELFDPPVPAATTLASTGLAFLGCLAFAWWSYRRWRAGGHEPGAVDATLSFAGVLLALFSAVAVLFVGLPALVLEC
jgi:hypothetical protein